MASELYGLTASQLDQLNQQAAYIARLVAESSRTIDGLQAARGIFDMTGGSPGVQPATALAVQMVKVTNGTPDGDGYYTGYWVQKDAAGLWEQQTEVRILPAGSAVLVSGEYYLAVAGLYTSTYYPIYIVPDVPRRTAYTWTSAKTANYSAAVWEAVLCDLSSGSFTVTLPQYSACVVNDRVLVAIIRNITANRTVSIAPYSGDKINGSTSNWVLTDSGTDYTTDGSAGGYWEFVRSSSSSLGWTCSRFLNT